jgi:hypothetical protein
MAGYYLEKWSHILFKGSHSKAPDARVVAFTHEIHTTQRAINSSSYLEGNNTSDFAKTNKELN